jgi:hypothetical protein
MGEGSTLRSSSSFASLSASSLALRSSSSFRSRSASSLALRTSSSFCCRSASSLALRSKSEGEDQPLSKTKHHTPCMHRKETKLRRHEMLHHTLFHNHFPFTNHLGSTTSCEKNKRLVKAHEVRRSLFRVLPVPSSVSRLFARPEDVDTRAHAGRGKGLPQTHSGERKKKEPQKNRCVPLQQQKNDGLLFLWPAPVLLCRGKRDNVVRNYQYSLIKRDNQHSVKGCTCCCEVLVSPPTTSCSHGQRC